MPYRVDITKRAAKGIAKISGSTRIRVVNAIEALADDPRPSGVKKLKGGSDEYRLRVGDYRIIYTVEDHVLTVRVVKVGHRRDIYEG